MPGNTFGTLFKLTTFGESHGPAIGGIIDGCPAGLDVDPEAVQAELDRRRPGQSAIVTQRKEPDTVEFLSGLFDGKTTGTPIGFVIRNKDHKSGDYDHLKAAFRPSHADYTYMAKYGLRDHRGGGRSSARETACRVVAGAVAQQVLGHFGIKVYGYVSQVGSITMQKHYTELDDLAAGEANQVRCPDPETAEAMIARIREIRKEGNTVGGVVSCVATGVPAGLGQPVFDKLHADLAKANMSINATRGFEIGSGFDAVEMKGSDHNDLWTSTEQGISTQSNRSGGIQGGISNGQDIWFRVAFKPVATIMSDQPSVNAAGEAVTLKGKGRHDPCVVPRAVPIVEAMTALVLADHLLRARADKL